MGTVQHFLKDGVAVLVVWGAHGKVVFSFPFSIYFSVSSLLIILHVQLQSKTASIAQIVPALITLSSVSQRFVLLRYSSQSKDGFCPWGTLLASTFVLSTTHFLAL